MKSYVIIVLLFLIKITIHAQQDAIWLLGDTTYHSMLPTDTCCAYEMHFMADTFEVQRVIRKRLAGANSGAAGVVHTGGGISAATICNQNGNLLLHCDSRSVYGADGLKIEGGDSLAMDGEMWTNTLSLSYRSIFFIPKPETPNHYYLIHPFQERGDVTYFGVLTEDLFFTSLMYSEIDMNANNGKGIVLPRQTLVQDTLMLASISVTRHANGRDWWIIAPHYTQNKYYRFLIDPTGLHTYPPQIIGDSPNYDFSVTKGAYFSQDGSILVLENPKNYHFMDFDRCTGLFNNYREMHGINYDCPYNFNNNYEVFSALSPNNRFLYVANLSSTGPIPNCTYGEDIKYNRLYQYDLWNPADTPTIIMECDATPTDNGRGTIGAPYLTPNGLIVLDYSGWDTNTTLNFIKKPNLKGLLCEPTRVQYGKYGRWNGSALPNYSLGPLIGSACDTLAHTGIAPMRDEAGVEVYPNPTQDKLHIHLSTLTETRIVLYNVLGEEVYTGTSNGKETELSLAALPQGLYFLIVKTKENRIFTEKVIKQ